MPTYKQPEWWKEAVVYQVYPASFMDGNGDGWGDIAGMTSKLDHLKELGVDVLWTSPIYKSPQVDMGYDIADYKDIDPKYGTLAEVDNLIAELKKRDMKLMMDLVVNHTSDQHAWFLESKSSLKNPKRDWYIWKKGKTDKDGNKLPPNNWAMILGEENSAWNYDEKSEEWFLALFTPEQPDLNWENPEVREAVHDVLRFWLDRGVCGFRMDVINLISKVQSFPDAEVVSPDHAYQPGFKFFANGPRLHEYLKDMNRKVLAPYNAMTVGEMPFVDDEAEILRVVGAEEEELRMIFIFELVYVDDVPGTFRMTLRDWKPKEIKRIVSRWQRYMIENNGWNSVFCSNHDNPRAVSRYTDDSTPESAALGAKLLALMQTTLGGTPYVYQGEELGMTNFSRDWPVEDYKDVETLNYWNKMNKMHPGDKKQLSHAIDIMHAKARDHARTPVQWTSGPNAGFCPPTTQPWMRVNSNHTYINAAAQLSPPDPSSGEMSVFRFWQRGLADRKKHKEAFVYGDFEVLDEEGEDVFAYLRSGGGERFLVVLNFSGEARRWEMPGGVEVEEWVCGNYTAGKPERATGGVIEVKAWEGLLGICRV